MWLPDKTNLVKVRLHEQGEDVETVWAEDLGASEGSPGSRLVRLGNVPFLHADREEVLDELTSPLVSARMKLLSWSGTEDAVLSDLSEGAK